MPTTNEILRSLADNFEQRAKDRDEDAKVHNAAGLYELASYDTGLATAYRGAARATLFQMTGPA